MYIGGYNTCNPHWDICGGEYQISDIVSARRKHQTSMESPGYYPHTYHSARTTHNHVMGKVVNALYF